MDSAEKAHDESSFQGTHCMKLENCLAKVYQLDQEQITKLSSILNSIANQSLIDEFISLSNTISLIPVLQQKVPLLRDDDATLKAPHSHQVLFENAQLRILEVSVKPGEKVPSHRHQWGCIMVILQGSKFQIEDMDGNISEGEWNPLIEKFEGEKKSFSYINIGHREFKAIALEIKE